MLGSSGVFSRNLPVFDGKKFNNWCLKMNAIFDFQEVEEVFKNGFQEIGRNATKEQKAEYKELKKLNSKENRRNVQKGRWTRQYLNNTKLSPNEQKKEKETTT